VATAAAASHDCGQEQQQGAAAAGAAAREAAADGGDERAAKRARSALTSPAELPPLPAGAAGEVRLGIEGLLMSRRLCLVLDLDHTLVNSAKFAEIDPEVEYRLQDMLAGQVRRAAGTWPAAGAEGWGAVCGRGGAGGVDAGSPWRCGAAPAAAACGADAAPRWPCP
jgi:hypothetical protein